MLGQDARAWAEHLLAPSGEQVPVIRAKDVTLEDIASVGQAVVEQVQAKRSTWRRWNLQAAASRQTTGLRFAATTDRETLVGLIADAAEAASLRLTPPELTVAPAAFTRPDGSSVFRPRHATLYTSAALLAAEDRLLDLARTPTGPALEAKVLVGVAAGRDERGRVLSADQQSVVERISTSGRTLDLLVGPAGAGKTLTLGALRRAWERSYGPGSVIGLAPSAAAAEVLAGDLGIPTENTAKWVHEHTHDRWNLAAGQLVIVDEASLAGTAMLELLATHAARAGAKVLLAGDWAQLAAIDAGGAFGMLVRDRNNQPDSDPAPELTDVRRFGSEWEKTASLRLRQGDTDVIDLYDQHGRILDGEHDQILDAAYHAWQADTAAGRASILIAETSETVIALNNRARADRVLAGQVSLDGVGLHDGTVAGQGDSIVTRQNDRRLSTGKGWVKNGDEWTVLHAHADGSLTVRRQGARGRRGRVTLPAGYVAEHVELGYAITAHRAQGATVDTAHLLVHSSSMTREAFYVAMTRGRQTNTAYVATDEAHLEAHQHTPGFQAEHLTARSILYGVLQHEGAERSAHETTATEQDAWTSIGQLAAEYETIAQAAQHDRYAATVYSSSLDAEHAEAIASAESFGSLVAQLRRIEADGSRTGPQPCSGAAGRPARRRRRPRRRPSSPPSEAHRHTRRRHPTTPASPLPRRTHPPSHRTDARRHAPDAERTRQPDRTARRRAHRTRHPTEPAVGGEPRHDAERPGADVPPGNSRSGPSRRTGTATASAEPTRSARRRPARASASTTSAPRSPPAEPKPRSPRVSRASARETSESKPAATSADSPTRRRRHKGMEARCAAHRVGWGIVAATDQRSATKL